MSMKWMRGYGGTWFVWNLVMATLSAATIISQPRVEIVLQQRPRRGTSSANNMSMKRMRGYGGTRFVWNLVVSTLSAAPIISQPRVEVILQQRPRRGI